MRNTVTELENKLRQFYGNNFDELLTKAEKNPKNKTHLGVLNELNRVQENGVSLEGAYLGKGAKRGKNEQIVSAWFRVLDSNGKSRGIFLHDLKFVDKLPEEPPKLTGTRWTNLNTSVVVSQDLKYYRTTDTTKLEIVENLDFPLPELSTYSEALERTRASRANGKGDPYFTIAGEISDVNTGEDKESGRKWIRADVADVNGTRFSVNLDQNLRDLFGEADWLEDYEIVANNLYHMPVLLNGRIWIGENKVGKEKTSFVVKRSGWVANITKLSETVQTKLEKALF